MSEQLLQEALLKLNKTFGKGSIRFLGDTTTEDYDVISTGSIGFDHIVLGVGGYIKGRMYDLRGWEGSGKSSLCGHAIAECQRKGGRVALIDGEHAMDVNYFKSLGVDIDKLLLSQPDYGEEGFEIAKTLIQTGEIDLLIIDSDSSLIPKKAMEGEAGDASIGLKARLNGQEYPKLKLAARKFNTCIIVVSQYREKIGVFYGDPKVVQGGHTLKFYADTIIEIGKKVVKEGEESLANRTKMKTIKNKTFSPFRSWEVDIVFGKGIDKTKEVMDMAIELDIIKKYGNKITIISTGEKLDFLNKDTAEKEFLQMLVDNPELKDSISQQIKDKISPKQHLKEVA